MRLAGQMLENNVVKNSNQHIAGNEEVPALKDLGLTKNESSTYQKIASIPEDVFEQEMDRAKQGRRGLL